MNKFNTLNHGELCPEICDATTRDWGPAKRLKVTSVNQAASDQVIILDPHDARDYAKYYRRRFCFLNKKHTRSIYLPALNYRFIGDFFNDPDNYDYDGIRIFLRLL